MNDYLPFIYVACTIAGIILFYHLVRFAVIQGTKDLVRSNRILINLKALELKNKGVSDQELLQAVDQVNELDHLKRQKLEGRIDKSQFEQKKRALLV